MDMILIITLLLRLLAKRCSILITVKLLRAVSEYITVTPFPPLAASSGAMWDCVCMHLCNLSHLTDTVNRAGGHGQVSNGSSLRIATLHISKKRERERDSGYKKRSSSIM